MATRSGKLTPRPYARLLTMLSNQLIKNNTIALTELAKNSYDADASWVQVRIGNMQNFGKDGLNENAKPFVEIEDDGDGMSFETVRDHWMNPASPNKFIKRGTETTRKRRIIQGEKGIGRYAVFQIGKKVEIYTRERVGENKGGDEINLVTDLSEYDEDILSRKTSSPVAKPLFFDQLSSKYYIRDAPRRILPEKIRIESQVEKRKNHGTFIRITNLNYEWTLPEVERIRTVLSRLQSPFRRKDFAVSIVFNDDEVFTFTEYKIDDVLEEALLKMVGSVDENGICNYSVNGFNGEINLIADLKEDWVKENREHFTIDDEGATRKPRCGPFGFTYYLYRPLSTIADKKLADYIRGHRIYIYRDDIRVYPYGDRDNDWLRLDIYRGTVKAGYYLSNDQLIGYVNISTAGNPSLRDKTNREGLLEQGTAYEDLRLLNLSALNFLNKEYRKSLEVVAPKKHRKERTSNLFLQTEAVDKRINDLGRYLKKSKDKEGKHLLNGLTEEYYRERNIYRKQIEIVEDLAGVGIAVDATSHDLMLVMDRAVERVDEIQTLANAHEIDQERLKDKVDALTGQLSFMRSLLTGIQPLFRSSRRRKKELKISNIIETVKRYYVAPIKKIKADVAIREVGSPLIVPSSEGVLLQLFINLMDNSVYWLKASGVDKPKIEMLIDGDGGYVIFADNGPGVRKEDIDYIFEPFFTTKGMQGRGLGLYIARQLTDRYEYDLYYLEDKSKQILTGANFKIDFFEQED